MAHLDHSNKLHGNFALLLADEAARNAIIVCRKCYLDVHSVRILSLYTMHIVSTYKGSIVSVEISGSALFSIDSVGNDLT